jgi:hypothetical protein
MQTLTDKRNNTGTVKHRVLAAFMVLWISFGLQPCAMGAVDDIDCPHCPAEQMQPMAAGSDHCNPPGESSFSTAPSDCYEVEESAVGDRLGKFDCKDAGKFSAAIDVSESLFSIRFDAFSINAAGPPGQSPRAQPIPLHILYCVYRD